MYGACKYYGTDQCDTCRYACICFSGFNDRRFGGCIMKVKVFIELRERLEAFAEKAGKEVSSDENIQKLAEGCIWIGATWMANNANSTKQAVINKACEWLDANINKDFVSKKDFIDNLRKAMED